MTVADRRLPPSLFISERDRLRANQPMPLAERCIEDYQKQRAERLAQAAELLAGKDE